MQPDGFLGAQPEAAAIANHNRMQQLRGSLSAESPITLDQPTVADFLALQKHSTQAFDTVQSVPSQRERNMFPQDLRDLTGSA